MKALLRKRTLIILLLIISAISAVVFRCSHDFPLAAPIEVMTNAELIEIEHNNSTETCTDEEWISGLVDFLKNAKPTRRQSVDDFPYADDYYTVTLVSGTMTKGPFFVYMDDGKTYIEFPYEGIYLADDSLIEYLTETETGDHNG